MDFDTAAVWAHTLAKTGFVSEDAFWEEEVREGCSLMRKNYGFLEQARQKDNCASLFVAAAGWMDKADVPSSEADAVRVDFSAFAAKFYRDRMRPDRIFVRDAERLFNREERRQLVIVALTFLQARLSKEGHYHQGLGLCLGFLLLTLDAGSAVALLLRMGSTAKYAQDLWLVREKRRKLCLPWALGGVVCLLLCLAICLFGNLLISLFHCYPGGSYAMCE